MNFSLPFLGHIKYIIISKLTSKTLTSSLFPGNAVQALVKCLKGEHRILKKVFYWYLSLFFLCLEIVILFIRSSGAFQEAAWVLSNIAAGSVEHKRLIYSSEAMALLLHLLSTAAFDIKKEVAYVLGNICVAPAEGSGRPNVILDHLVNLVRGGCLTGFLDLVRSADVEAARLGLQFIELVSRIMLVVDQSSICFFP